MAAAKVIFFAFAMGLSFGGFMTYLGVSYIRPDGILNQYMKRTQGYEFGQHDTTHSVIHRHGQLNVTVPVDFDADKNDPHHVIADKQAKEEAQRIRILCWIMTSPKTLHTKGKPIKETWAKRCNIVLFMSSQEDPSFSANVIGLDVGEGRDKLWHKTRAAWQYVHDKHINDAEWFIKADDDTYVIVENLRHFVSKHKPDDPHFFGRYFKTFGGYNSGGAGYVFSRETLRVFAKLLKDPSRCPKDSWAEDMEVGKCLAKMGIHPGDTRDPQGRESFHPLPPEHHLIPGYLPKDFWLWQYDYHGYKEGPECCSDHSITFHYINPNMMYQLEYFVYHLRPFGIQHSDHDG